MPAKFQFVMRSGPTVGALYPLEGDLITIGRDATNSIQINDAEISRRHARLQFQGGKYVIDDAGSTNGTHVNGQRILSPYVLKTGDVVSFGEGIVLGFDAVNFDPGATLASARPPAARAIPSAPSPAQPYAGQVPAGPMPASVKRNPLPIFVAIGVIALICACAAFFLWVDAANMWCTFFPFLGGCP
ncbi:MAG: FHA domain-containing protein [Chloroflexi bacterium]|nr:FHA domain-containing protein [Chloroflexota bacterium]